MEAAKYPKIQTVFNRDPATKHRTLLDGDWSRSEFWWLRDLDWEWTEKVDGTNIRVEWNPETGVMFGGRTERAQIPATLVAHLQETFSEHEMRGSYPDTAMCLYGEGYGARIQKGGGNYIPDGVSFVLFDVQCGGLWLEREDVLDIAENLEVKVVPIAGEGPLREAVDLAKEGFPSVFGTAQAEGLVMRPPFQMSNRRGQRIMCKVKHKDFKQEAPHA